MSPAVAKLPPSLHIPGRQSHPLLGKEKEGARLPGAAARGEVVMPPKMVSGSLPQKPAEAPVVCWIHFSLLGLTVEALHNLILGGTSDDPHLSPNHLSYQLRGLDLFEHPSTPLQHGKAIVPTLST